MNKLIILGIMAFVLCSFAFGLDATNITLVMEFEDDYTSEVGVHTGTPSGDPTFVAGKVGSKAVELDGDDWINQSAHADFDLSTSASICFWTNPTSCAQNSCGFIMKDENGVSNGDYYIGIQDNVNDDFRYGVGGVEVLDGTADIMDGAWHHICVTYDANLGVNQVKMYVDGSLDVEAAQGNIPTNSYDLVIGYFYSPTYAINGKIDQLILGKTTFNLANVQEIYNSGNGKTWADLLAGTNFSTSLTYPTDKATYYGLGEDSGMYNGSINIGLTYVNGSANCTLNDTRWGFNYNNNITYSFINNTDIIGSNISISYSCNDTGGAVSNGSFWFYLDTILDLTFYNEESLTIMNTTNVSFVLISGSHTENHTTDEGNYSIYSLTAGDYEITYTAEDYITRQYYLTIEAGHKYNVTLYLLNDTLAERISVNLYNEFGSSLTGYYIHTMRRIGGVYYPVEISKTNSNGETDFYGITNTPMYYWIIKGEDGTIYEITLESEIFGSTLDFYITQGSPIDHIFSTLGGLSYSLTYDNNTKVFTYVYSHADAVDYNLLGVYRLRDDTLISSNSSTQQNGILTVDLSSLYSNGTTYYAEATVNASPEIYIDSLTITYPESAYQIGTIGLFMTAIILVALTFVGYWNPAIMFVLQAVAVFLTRLGGLHQYSYTSTTSIALLLLVFAYIVSDRT